jgi:hypothetical protein
MSPCLKNFLLYQVVECFFRREIRIESSGFSYINPLKRFRCFDLCTIEVDKAYCLSEEFVLIITPKIFENSKHIF